MAFESLTEKLNAAFKKLRGKGRLTSSDIKEAMREVRMALLEADVSYKVVKDFTKSVTERASGAEVLEALSPAQMVIKIVNEELCALMGGENEKINISSKSPSIVMLVGLQGAGKTTNGAKLAAYMRKQSKRPHAIYTDLPPSSSLKLSEHSLISRFFRWDRLILSILQKLQWNMQRSTATIWYSSILQDGCISMRSS